VLDEKQLQDVLDTLAELYDKLTALDSRQSDIDGRADHVFARDKMTEHTPVVGDTIGEKIMADSLYSNQFRDAQVRADKVYQGFGDSAPPAVDGELLPAYRLRLLRGLKQHSPDWKNTDLVRLPEDILAVAERTILADAAREIASPTNVPAGTLLQRIEQDATGRKITRFHGDPEACWAPFKSEPKYVVAWPGVTGK
jgi:hypothetical protein